MSAASCTHSTRSRDQEPHDHAEELSPGLAVEEHHVLPDGLAVDVQLIGGEVWVGVADRQASQNRQFRRDSQLCADDFRIPRDRDLDASTQALFGQGQ
jgi:hypothetical protein